MIDKATIADALDEIAALLELKGENDFKVRAYANGARLVRGSPLDLDDFVREATAGRIKGIGAALSEKIAILAQTGSLPFLNDLREELPPGLFEMMRIPGLGAKKVRELYAQLGIDELSELEEACLHDRLVDLKGFGAKTQAKILAGIRQLASYGGQYRLVTAWLEAERLAAALAETGLCSHLEIVGSIRRRLETVHNVNLLAVSPKPRELMEVFGNLPGLQSVDDHGPALVRVTTASGAPAELRLVTPGEWASALVYFTGSKEHVARLQERARERGFDFGERGLRRGNKPLELNREADCYAALDLAEIPPELREGADEIELAERDALPALVTMADLRGVLHVHSTYSDGVEPLAQLAAELKAMGYHYLGVTDHSQTAGYAGGLKPDDVRRQHEEIDRLNAELAPFRIFKGIESDILPDGSLDYDEPTLALFDFVIASVHSHFRLSEADMTRRVVRAIENPHTTILGHPTGRLLLTREAYAIDMNAVLAAAAKHGVAIELNAHPYRLDLDWRLHRRAKEMGIRIPILPDAHELGGLQDLRYGLGAARKGGLTAADVPNCWPVDPLAAWLARRKR